MDALESEPLVDLERYSQAFRRGRHPRRCAARHLPAGSRRRSRRPARTERFGQVDPPQHHRLHPRPLLRTHGPGGPSGLSTARWLRGDLRRLRLDKIGFIFQFHNLLPFLTATENVAIVLDLAGVDDATPGERAVELLDYLGVGHRRDAFPAHLSGGEAQRVAIARALANRPRIILADEPTAALDSERAQTVMDLLRRVAVEQRAAILTVTHDDKIFGRFDRIFDLRDGVLMG